MLLALQVSLESKTIIFIIAKGYSTLVCDDFIMQKLI